MWNPVEKPYRVLPIYRSGNPLHYGWQSGKTEVFASEAEARSYAATIKGAKSVVIHKAVNAETWLKNGRWQKL